MWLMSYQLSYHYELGFSTRGVVDQSEWLKFHARSIKLAKKLFVV